MDHAGPDHLDPVGTAAGIGQAVRRREDWRLLRGEGRFADDLSLPGQAYAACLRAPHAHAAIGAIDKTAALAIPGVLAVFTGADLRAGGVGPIPHNPSLPGPPDASPTPFFPPIVTPHEALPADRARFVGEAIAIVVGETRAAAKDGMEALVVAYETLPAITSAAAGLAEGAATLWQTNLLVDGASGDEAATEAAFAAAAYVVQFDTRVNRVTGVPMEPRAGVAAYDEATGFTLHAGSGNVMRQKRELAGCLGVKEARVRVIAHDIGGNFGTRNAFYGEFAALAFAARALGRPVKWTCERSESFASDYQGRDLAVRAELALDAAGNFLAFRSTNTLNIGAHTVIFAPIAKGVSLMTSVYGVPVAHVHARAVATNMPPINSYRSSGRPEAIYVMERLIDLACRRHGFDRVALRERNLVPPTAMPYANPLGLTYDNGEYAVAMRRALALADWDGFAARRAESRARGMCRGIGVANYIEIASGALRERTDITVRPDGTIEVIIGTLASGQGHETSFAQLVTSWLGVEIECVDIVTGDTDRLAWAGGTQAGRSMRMASVVMDRAISDIIEQGRKIAARLLQAEVDEVSFAEARFTAGEASVGLFEVAAAETLAATCDRTVDFAGYPYGAQVCEMEVDPETGVSRIVNYVAVDDVGRAVNPMIVHGQTHGAAVQGIGQAMLEECTYDAETGQLLAGSFMDYAMPRADQMPNFVTDIMEIPSPSNRLGIRAGGEGGTTPALAVVINAIVHALEEFGVDHIEMPATPERVWRAIQAGTR